MRLESILIIAGLLGSAIYAMQNDEDTDRIMGNERQEEKMTAKREMYRYAMLPAGAIQPEGWIRNQLQQDLIKGYIGSFDEVHPTVTRDVFVNQDRKSKRKFSMRKEWWSGEHEGYWRFLTEQYLQRRMDTSGSNTSGKKATV